MRKLLHWVFLQSEGISLSDKIALFFAKIFYLLTRVMLRLALGKKRRDLWFIANDLDFGVFWHEFSRIFRPHKAAKLSKFKSRKYGFEYYCRDNSDDFKIMSAHEQEILEHFLPSEGDIVIDVGAHLGLYTIIGARRVGANGKVLAIEADPANFKMLKQNLWLNQLYNVKPLNFAAYSKEGSLRLYLKKIDSGFTKYNTVMPAFTSSNEHYITVMGTTLDNIIDEEGISARNINWLKIDVEGAEFEVLAGAHKILTLGENLFVLLELHGGTSHSEKLFEIVKLYNFKVLFERKYSENGSAHLLLKKMLTMPDTALCS